MFFLREALRRVGVDLRHDQRHVGVHAPGRGIVDDDAALRADLRRPFLRHRAARRHQADVGRREVVILERLALEDAVAERDLLADRARTTPARRLRRRGSGARREWRAFRGRHCRWRPTTATLKPCMRNDPFAGGFPPSSAPRGRAPRRPAGGGAGAEGAVNPSRRLWWRRAICSSFSSREAASQGSELRRRGAGTTGGKHGAAAKSMRPIKPRRRRASRSVSARSGSLQSGNPTIERPRADWGRRGDRAWLGAFRRQRADARGIKIRRRGLHASLET